MHILSLVYCCNVVWRHPLSPSHCTPAWSPSVPNPIHHTLPQLHMCCADSVACCSLSLFGKFSLWMEIQNGFQFRLFYVALMRDIFLFREVNMSSECQYITKCHVKLKYDIYCLWHQSHAMTWLYCVPCPIITLEIPSPHWTCLCCLCTAARCSYDKSSFYAQSAAQRSHFCNVIFIHKLAKSCSVLYCDLIWREPRAETSNMSHQICFSISAH